MKIVLSVVLIWGAYRERLLTRPLSLRPVFVSGFFTLFAILDLYFAPQGVCRADPVSIAVSMAISFAITGAQVGLQYALASKQKVPPIDRGRLDDIRISIAGYNEHILKLWGKARGAPIWIWDSRIVHTTVTTPGQSGGKGPPKPPTPDTVDHIYTKSLAGVCHDGIIYNDITRMWFDLDLVFNGNLLENSALYREAEFATLAGGATIATSAVCSNGRKVTGLGNGGKATFAVNTSAGSYEVSIAYISSSDLTFKVSVNGGAAQDVLCTSSGGSAVAYKVFNVTLTSGANTLEFANAAAACPDLDRIQIAPTLVLPEGFDPRSWTGIQDPSRVFPTERDSPWGFQNEQPIPIDGYGTSNGASRVGSSANLTKWGSPTIRFYQGTTTQDPDSAIVTDKGAGNVPGYHDFAYLVLESLQLQNGRLPNVTVEIDQGTRDVRTIVEDLYRLCGVDSTNLELSQLNGLILGDTEGFSEGTYSDITWAGVSNATTGAGGSFAKSGGGDGWTSYANSGASIAAGTDYAIRATIGTGVGMIGFATTNTPGNSLPHPYDQMPFAVLWNVDSVPSQEAKNALQMSLGGSNNTSDIGTWSPGDQLQIEVRDGSFYAYQNGALLTGFVTPVPSYPLKVVVMGYKPVGDPDGGGVTAASQASGSNIGSRPTIVNAGALVVATRRPASEILNDLMTRFQFDMVNVDGKEKAVLRNASSVDIVIPYADLRAHLSGEEMPAWDCEILDIDPILLPHRVDVVYLDPQLDYHTNVQSDMLASGPQTEIMNISLSVVDSADNAKKLSTTLLNKSHMESRSFKFRLGPKYLHTMPGTIATLQLPNATHTVRFTQWKAQLPAGVIEVEAVRHAASVYSPTAIGSISAGYEPPIVSIVGNTEGIILDGPLLRPEDAGDGTQPVVYVGGCHRGAGTFDGFFFYMEYPINSGNYELVTGGNFDKQADIGVTTGTLASVVDPSVWDRVSSVTVNFYTDVALTSQTEADLLNNPTLNLFAVMNPSTFAVEYVQAATVSSSAATAPYKSRYTLSTFLRGRIGTDNNVGAHTSADKVCVVNSALKPIRMNVVDIGR
ncbi:MAG TPA: phage tail protein [Pyrinomonadaceae bacterium]|nr:phage tail protein [Pyrinomonadaceae bacterium]